MKRLIVVLFAVLASAHAFAATNPLSIQVGAHTFVLPLQKVSGTELYSFRDGKGFPALETVLYNYKKFQVTFGAAAVLGTTQNVPFLGAQFVLPTKFFDTTNNDLLFGAYAGKEHGKKGLTVGIKASKPLW